MSKLAETFARHGSDKHVHRYHLFYATLPPPVAMMECGVFRGASLRAWRNLWPHARIVGVDTFQRDVSLLHDSDFAGLDVELVAADCRTSNLAAHALLDLIIDDASHKPRDQAATFRNLWPLLAPGGTYVIEDVVFYDQPLGRWFRDRAEDFNENALTELQTACVMSGGIYATHDFRGQSGRSDSVLVVIRKP